MAFTAKFMAFYLLLGSFLPQTDFSQLLKLNKLMEHYDFHVEQAQAQGDVFSFGEYLCIHFIHPDQHEHNDSSHNDLPLHTFSGGLTMIALQTGFHLPVPSSSSSPTSFATQQWHSQNFLGMLLRPPIA